MSALLAVIAGTAGAPALGAWCVEASGTVHFESSAAGDCLDAASSHRSERVDITPGLTTAQVGACDACIDVALPSPEGLRASTAQEFVPAPTAIAEALPVAYLLLTASAESSGTTDPALVAHRTVVLLI